MAKITGKVLYIYPAQQLTSKSGNAFSKRDFVIAVQRFDPDTGEATIDDTNTPQLTLTGDRSSQLENIKQGDIVTVDYYLRGRRFRGEDNKEKIITDINVTSVRLNAVRLEPVVNAKAPDAAPNAAPASATQPKGPNDDLPF